MKANAASHSRYKAALGIYNVSIYQAYHKQGIAVGTSQREQVCTGYLSPYTLGCAGNICVLCEAGHVKWRVRSLTSRHKAARVATQVDDKAGSSLSMQAVQGGGCIMPCVHAK